MNAENAEYQILLALQASHYRSRELDSLRTAAGAVICLRSSKESRTLLARAFYLTLLAARLEKLLCNQCNQALQSLSRLSNLPDELQWEYRSAHTLGVARTMVGLGQLQIEIIAQTRQSLADACALVMAQAPNLELSIHAGRGNGLTLDVIDETLLGLSPRQGRRMLDMIGLAVEQSKNQLSKARLMDDQPGACMSIAAIFCASASLSQAQLLASMTAYCLEATGGGGFIDEPLLLPVGQAVEDNERVIARLLAAGYVASRISALYERQNPTLSVSLN